MDEDDAAVPGGAKVSDLFTPERTQRRIAALSEQRFIAASLLPPRHLNRRQRIARRLRGLSNDARERVALRIAPWLQP